MLHLAQTRAGCSLRTVSVGLPEVKGIVQSKQKFQPFTTHPYVAVGSGGISHSCGSRKYVKLVYMLLELELHEHAPVQEATVEVFCIETRYVFRLFEYLATISFNQVEFSPSMKLNISYVDLYSVTRASIHNRGV